MRKLTKKNILVTGGAGFIGANFLNHVVLQYPNIQWVNLDVLTYAADLNNLCAIENKDNYTFVEGDIRDKALLSELFEQYQFQGWFICCRISCGQFD